MQTLAVRRASEQQSGRKYGHRRSQARSSFSPQQLGGDSEEANEVSSALADYAAHLAQPEGLGTGLAIALAP